MKYRSKILLLSCCTMLAVAGCSKRPKAQPQGDARESRSLTPASASKVKIDPCTLLTSEEIESVQGEPVKETKSSSQSGASFVVSQCYFNLPTSANSISVVVTQRAEGPDARDPKQFWRETFQRDEDSEEAGERDKPKGREEDERKSPPEKIMGIGDQAYWTGSPVGTALYVIKGDRFIRISVGGSGDQSSKLEKSKKLAQFALKRLSIIPVTGEKPQY